MTQDITVSDDTLALHEHIFNDHIDGLTYEQLMQKYSISKRQVGNMLAKARTEIFEQLMETGRRYFAEIWTRYNYIYGEAKTQWEVSRDSNLLKEMRACLEAQRRLLGLDAPPLAAVNSQGSAVPNQVILIMNPSAYEQKEKQVAEIIDGKATEIQ